MAKVSFKSKSRQNSRTFIHINMLRVLLKVEKVNIRIKETVELHIYIRKGAKAICYCKKEPLTNGELILQHSSEFFITPNDPAFRLEIYLVKGTLKKQGGEVPIDLRNFPMNASHSISTPIRKSPLQSSFLELNFVYMASEQEGRGLQMMGQGELESMTHKAYINQMAQQNEQLMEEKNRLEDEIRHLKSKNEELQVENNMIEEEMTLRKKECSEEIHGLEEQKQSTQYILTKEKEKIAQIVDIINQSGNYDLISKAENIIGGKEMEPE